MKKILSALCMLCAFIAATQAATVSGTVKDTNGQPIANKSVSVSEDTAMNFWHTTALTDINGFYTVTVPVNVANGNLYAVTQDCNNNDITHQYAYTGASIVSDFTICIYVPPPFLGAKVYGTVHDPLGVGLAGKTVEVHIDPAGTWDTSVVTNASGYYSLRLPVNTALNAPVHVQTTTCDNTPLINTYTYDSSDIQNIFGICDAVPPAGGAYAYGWVKNVNGVPLANKTVYAAVDSVAVMWNGSAITDVNGYYQIPVPNNLTANSIFWVWTNNCNNGQVSREFRYSTYSYPADFKICIGDSVRGKIFSSNPNVGSPNAVVYFIRQTYDSAAQTHILTLIDSTITDVSGSYVMKTPVHYFDTVLLKAALLPAAANYSNYLPTYHTSSLNWSGGTNVPTGPQVINLQLIAGVNPGGPGFIGGDVLQGANKSTAVGDPLYKKILILTDANNNAVAYTYSDGAGQFSFNNLAYGTYKIFGDAPGIANPALVLTLDAAHPSITNIEFEQHIHEFEGHITTSVVNTNSKLSAISLYPNPALNDVNIIGLETLKGTKTITLRSMNGAVVFTQSYNDGEKAMIPVSALSKGVYMLSLHTAEGVATFKVVK